MYKRWEWFSRLMDPVGWSRVDEIQRLRAELAQQTAIAEQTYHDMGVKLQAAETALAAARAILTDLVKPTVPLIDIRTHARAWLASVAPTPTKDNDGP